MNDSISYNFLLVNDTTNKIIQLKPDEQSGNTSRYTFSYLTDNNKDEKKLTDSLDNITLVIKKFTKDDFPLLKKRNKILSF